MNSRFIAALIVMFLLGAGMVLLLRPVTRPPETPPAAPQEQAAPAPTPLPEAPGTTTPPGKPEFFILAASWQPAFCEGAPNRPECESLGQKRFDATHFSLHGLWPLDEYCGVSQSQRDYDEAGRWSQLTPVELDPATQKALEQAMPGTRSQLERHEWTKHGTCYGTDQARYFGTSILLLSALNGSEVQQLFASSVGRQLSTKRIRAAFDSAFGAGAGERVKVSCKDDGDRRLIDEITLGLYGAPGDSPNLGALLAAARPTSPGCAGGIVDAVGFQ